MPRVTLSDLANKQHGPSKAVMPYPAPPCPQCGSRLEVDEQAIKGTGPVDRPVLTKVRAAFCTGCEFSHEF